MDADRIFKWPVKDRWWESKDQQLIGRTNLLNRAIADKSLERGGVLLYAEDFAGTGNPLVPTSVVVVADDTLRANLAKRKDEGNLAQPGPESFELLREQQRALAAKYPDKVVPDFETALARGGFIIAVSGAGKSTAIAMANAANDEANDTKTDDDPQKAAKAPQISSGTVHIAHSPAELAALKRDYPDLPVIPVRNEKGEDDEEAFIRVAEGKKNVILVRETDLDLEGNEESPEKEEKKEDAEKKDEKKNDDKTDKSSAEQKKDSGEADTDKSPAGRCGKCGSSKSPSVIAGKCEC